MMAFPGMLVSAAEKAGMKVPVDPDNFDRNEYPHFAVFCALQLGRAMEPTEHWDNAEILATLSEDEIKTIDLPTLMEKGFRIKDCYGLPVQNEVQ